MYVCVFCTSHMHSNECIFYFLDWIIGIENLGQRSFIWILYYLRKFIHKKFTFGKNPKFLFITFFLSSVNCFAAVWNSSQKRLWQKTCYDEIFTRKVYSEVLIEHVYAVRTRFIPLGKFLFSLSLFFRFKIICRTILHWTRQMKKKKAHTNKKLNTFSHLSR